MIMPGCTLSLTRGRGGRNQKPVCLCALHHLPFLANGMGGGQNGHSWLRPLADTWGRGEAGF